MSVAMRATLSQFPDFIIIFFSQENNTFGVTSDLADGQL